MNNSSYRSNLNRMTSVLLAAAPFAALGAAAQEAQTTSAGPVIEQVVVTGSIIRGVEAPVGSPITVVGREEIENTSAATTQDILKSIPSISNTQAVAQGSLVGSSYFAPTIRSLGSSASNSTLVLIDGHRIPLGNTSHPLPDPSIIPTIALERVEVVADGASAVYGSDAVAGVINFITRESYDGLLTTAQAGFGDDYDTKNFGLLWGTSWDDGSAMLAYNFGYKSALPRSSRDFLGRDHRAQGGTNFRNYACEPATLQPAGSSDIYASASATSPLTEAPCEETVSDHISDQTRHSVMAKLRQRLSDSVTASVDLVYSYRENRRAVSRGTIQATAFQTGDQANPFYTNPPGVDATKQTVRLLADELLGPGAYNLNTGEVYYASGELKYEINDRFNLTAFGMAGRTLTNSITDGTICSSCANLALNGTTNSGGNPATASIPGTDIIITGWPLTTQNALDVWRPAGSNRTSPEVLRNLTKNRSTSRAFQTIEQARAILDGALFDLPGGSLRAAVGAELVRYTLTPHTVQSNNTGPYNRGASVFDADIDRDVKSFFGEVLVPVIGPDNAIPLVDTFELNASLRHDEYAVFGGTTNPKFGFNWTIVDGLKLRGSKSESFVAPAMTSFGDPQGLATFSNYGIDTRRTNVPVEAFPEVLLLPGCENATTHCAVGSGTLAQGVSTLSGNRSLVPQTGKSWSVGVDIAPPSLPLRASVTWFSNEFRGGITSPNPSMAVNTPALHHMFTIYPNGATPEELAAAVGAAPQTRGLPPVIYFISNQNQSNVVNLDIAGLDVAADYVFDTDLGSFSLGGSATYFTKFDQFFGDGDVFSVLNTQGLNQTFSSVRMQGRAKLRWQTQDFSATTYVNFTSSHRNWGSGTKIPIGLTPAGNPDGSGGDRVGSNVTVDLHISYNLAGTGIALLGQGEIYLDGTNIFDRDPPFYNSADGYGPYNASPIGRVISVGLRYPW